ncbi:saccharopine dehydrogenase-like oxidoreductase, partial [Trichonephila inaurata madagascariensis]
GGQGKTIGYGTFISLLNSLRDYFNYSKFEREVQEKVFNKKPKKMKFPLKFGWIPMLYSWKEKAWCIKNMGPDVRNIRRSQMFRANYTDNGSLIDVQGYLKLPSLMKGLFYAYVFFLCLFTVFGFGKSLLMKYAPTLTFGFFSKTGPTRQQVLEGSTKLTFYAEGWKNEFEGSLNEHSTRPNSRLKLTINGP